MFRRWKESKGADDEYKKIIAYVCIIIFSLHVVSCIRCVLVYFRREVEASKLEAAKDGVTVPTTLEVRL